MTATGHFLVSLDTPSPRSWPSTTAGPIPKRLTSQPG